MVSRKMPRVQQVVLPILREAMPHVTFVSWIPDVDHRTYPMVEIRRLGGLPVDVQLLDNPVVEITSMNRDGGIVQNEEILLDVREVLWRAVQNQTVVPGVGYLHSYFETMGPTNFDAKFDDTWRSQFLVQLGVRPVRS